MLKLNASYSKKVPAEGEYSSQSYHASIEVELPDGLTPVQLSCRAGSTKRLKWSGTLSKPNCTEIPSTSKGVTVRRMLTISRFRAVPLPARNRLIICFRLRDGAALLPPRSRHNTVWHPWSS